MKNFLILVIATCLVVSGCATTKTSTLNQPMPETVSFMPESNKDEGRKPFDREASFLDWAETIGYVSCYTIMVPATILAGFLNNSNDVEHAGFSVAIP